MSTDTNEQSTEYEQDPPAYRALSIPAVVSLVCAALSILTAFHWSLVAFPAFGIGLGLLAVRRIRQAPEDLTGLHLAKAGIILSAVLGGLGCGWQAYLRAAEVPDGYERISYAILQPDADVPGELIPPAASRLEGKRVFIKGYIDDTRKTNSKQFVIVPKVPHCRSCAAFNKPSEMIYVELLGDLEAPETERQIRFGGTFHIVESARFGGVPYQIMVDYMQ